MNHLPTGLSTKLATSVATLTLLAGAVLLAVVPAATAADPAPPIQFGMSAGAVSAQSAQGVKPDYGTFWLGPWTLKSGGWGGPDTQLTNLKAAGVTPAVHFYYWGDDISPSCVENGCWSDLHDAQKDREHWNLLATQMTDHLNTKMGGAPVVIFLESEFNKGGISTYEPFDGYLEAMAKKIHAAYPNAIIVLGFGNWGSNYWGTFDRAAAASDMVGVQSMRGSTRQTKTEMYTLYDSLLAGVKTLNAKFPGKDVMITDVAVSSYPEPEYVSVQRDVIKEVFDNLGALKALDVKAVIYRSWQDTPTMDTANWYGMAERYWGLANADGLKPSAHVWIDGVKAERAGSTPTATTTTTSTSSASSTSTTAPPTPAQAIAVGGGVSTQVESFATKTAGGKQSDSAAQGGAMWNLWSNGALAQAYNLTGAHDLTVRARGTSVGGVFPHMDVYLAGTKVLSANPGASYAEYRVTVNGTGIMEVRIAFTNDAKTSSEDRNLIVDAVAIAPIVPPVVANTPPTASFQASMDGLSIAVDASASSDADGDVLAFAWSFGDGASATGLTASHAFQAPGTYTVTLTANDGNASATSSRQVTAVQPNRAPTAAFAVAASELVASVDASTSTDPDGDALTYAWKFGDGSVATGPRASHAYAAAGTYLVDLTVSDGKATASATKAVTVTKPYAATFTLQSASNEWWVQEKVASSPAPAKVDIRVNGGSWQPMKHESYGDWTISMHIAKGSQVAFRATAPDGQTATSATQGYLGATSTSSSSTSVAFKATFSPKSAGNDWWVETAVSGNKGIAQVEANVGTGWIKLDKQDWGTYAKSIHTPDGAKVYFRAYSATGEVSYSAATVWT